MQPKSFEELRKIHEANQRPTVFVVDNDAVTRKRVRSLAMAAGLNVRSFSDAISLLKALTPEQPGCIVVGENTRSMSGLRLQEELAARHAPNPVILVAAEADVPTAVKAMRAGALDVIEQPALRERAVPSIIRAINADLEWRRQGAAQDAIRIRYAHLTQREREVADLVATGMTSGAIAKRLGLRERTVEIYRSRINKKMEARNAAELVGMLHDLKGRPGPALGGGGEWSARYHDNGKRRRVDDA